MSSDQPDILAFPPKIFGFTLLGGGVARLCWSYPLISWPISIVLGFVVGLPSAALALAAHRSFRRAGTPMLPELGASHLVTTGPYALSRNPLYLSQGLLFLMITCFINSLGMFFIFPIWFILIHFGIVLPEERYLKNKFGDAYDAYCGRVRRWI